MKKIDLFETFENAEDELMEDLTDMSPEISDEKLEKLLAVSERNYKMKKEETEGTRKEKYKEDESTVSGVERVKRTVWLRPLTMAASLVLIGATVAGSVALLNRGKMTNTDETTASDIAGDKEALKELCSNAPSHYDKLKASYKVVRIYDDITDVLDAQVEYDTKEDSVFVHRQQENSSESGYDSWNMKEFIYKNKIATIDLDNNWYDVLPYDISNEHLVAVENFWDPKGVFDLDYPWLGIAERLWSDWDIIGKDTVCGRECTVIEQLTDNGKLTAYFDAETGVELKYSYEGISVLGDSDGIEKTHTAKTEFEVTDIKYDDDAGHLITPLEFRQMIEEGGYRSEIREKDRYGNDVDPESANDLSYLGVPDISVTTTTVTSEQTTMTTTTDDTEIIFTTPVFEEPDAENMSFDAELGKIALAMVKKEEADVKFKINMAALNLADEYLEFSVDPEIAEEWDGILCSPVDGSSGLTDKVYYLLVDEPEFSNIKEMRRFGRSVYSANSIDLKRLNKMTAYLPDDLEQGDMISREQLRKIVEYRGKLYKLYYYLGIGHLSPVYFEDYPVIIADRTNTSFRAFIPFDINYNIEPATEEELQFQEVYFVFDTEYNDWRIEREYDRYDAGVYKKLADKVRGQ